MVIARSISRIFLQNSINLGLNLVICPTLEASEGDEVEVAPGKVVNRTTGQAVPNGAPAAGAAGHHRRRRAHPLHPQAHAGVATELETDNRPPRKGRS